jgi:hypothetical protein
MSSRVIEYRVHSSAIDKGISSVRVADGQRLGKVDLDCSLAAGEDDWVVFVVERVVGPVELKGSEHSLGGFGGVCRALKISVKLEELLSTFCDRSLTILAFNIEGSSGALNARSESSSSVQVDRGLV